MTGVSVVERRWKARRYLNLTQLEDLALSSVATINVADGHARQPLTEQQQKIISQLPSLFDEAATLPAKEIAARAHSAFFCTLGQKSFPADRVLACYSSSVAIEIVARSLVGAVSLVALTHPTFDNIADIVRGVGIGLVPVRENELNVSALEKILEAADCVFLTTPNNPTGHVISSEILSEVAGLCAARDAIVVLDTSFRGFDTQAYYDHYEILEQCRCRYIMIEDTGKLWPTLDLKAGFLVHSRNICLPLREIYSDILLEASTFILRLIEEFSLDAARGGLELMHAGIRENREALRAALASTPGVQFPDLDSRVSVERVACDRDTMLIWDELRARSVYVLPCKQFYWSNPREGERYLRVALARPRTVVEEASSALHAVISGRTLASPFLRNGMPMQS